jgi:sugar O-acyltransferase (sialic acid O-acetyltransferase NeuD family)
MEIETIYFVGAGGHGKVVLDALLKSGLSPNRIIVTDDDEDARGLDFLGFKVQHPAVQNSARQHCFHVAIGNGIIRKRIFDAFMKIESHPVTVLHPTAAISPFAAIDAGAFIAAHAVVAPGARVEMGAIINHGSVVDHDCHIGAFAHIAPNATIGGACRVGEGALVGAGANILPMMAIGAGAIIGAGAVVLRDIGAGETCAGVPAVSVSLR